jgi:hypothetical protein
LLHNFSYVDHDVASSGHGSTPVSSSKGGDQPRAGIRELGHGEIGQGQEPTCLAVAKSAKSGRRRALPDAGTGKLAQMRGATSSTRFGRGRAHPCAGAASPSRCGRGRARAGAAPASSDRCTRRRAWSGRRQEQPERAAASSQRAAPEQLERAAPGSGRGAALGA